MSKAGARIALVLVLGFAVALGCSSGSKSTSYSMSNGNAVETANVQIKDMSFDPKDVTVKVGDTVVWKNASRQVHTVTCDPSRVKKKEHVQLPEGAVPFYSGELKTDGTYRQTFTVAGTYRYVCSLHEDDGMTGTVTVSK